MSVGKFLFLIAVLFLWLGSMGCTTYKLSVHNENLELTWRDKDGMRFIKSTGSWFDSATGVTIQHIEPATDQSIAEDLGLEFRQIFSSVLGPKFFEKIYVDPKLSKLYLDSLKVLSILPSNLEIPNSYMEVLRSPTSGKVALLNFKKKSYALYFQSQNPLYKPQRTYFAFPHQQPGVYVTGVCDPSSEGPIPCQITISYKNSPRFSVQLSQKFLDHLALRNTLNRLEIRNIPHYQGVINKQ